MASQQVQDTLATAAMISLDAQVKEDMCCAPACLPPALVETPTEPVETPTEPVESQPEIVPAPAADEVAGECEGAAEEKWKCDFCDFMGSLDDVTLHEAICPVAARAELAQLAGEHAAETEKAQSAAAPSRLASWFSSTPTPPPSMPSKGKSQQAVMGEELWEIIKELRTRKQGTDLSSFVAPASMMLPFSTTELLLLGVSHSATGFAAAACEKHGPTRMLRVLSAQLGAMAHTLSAPMMKPYNPVLGEILAARGGEPAEVGSSAGSMWRAVVEQVSHHPPLTAFHVEGQAVALGASGAVSSASFRHYGASGAVPIFLGNTVEVRMMPQPGGLFLTLEDGTEEQYRVKSLPSMCLRNILGVGRSFCEWAGDLEVERVTAPGMPPGLVGLISFQPAKMFDLKETSAHRLTGAVTLGDAKTGPVLFQITGAWTGHVFAKATHGGAEIDLLPALPGGAERPTGMANLPEPPPYDLPSHSLRWARHPHAVWSELTTALRDQNWSVARTAKRAVEDGRRAEAAAMAQAGSMWSPALFDGIPLPDTKAWVLREGALDRAFDPDAEQPCKPM